MAEKTTVDLGLIAPVLAEYKDTPGSLIAIYTRIFLFHAPSRDQFDPCRDTLDQMLCVGVLRPEKHIVGKAVLHDLASLHDDHLPAQTVYNMQIMADKKGGTYFERIALENLI